MSFLSFEESIEQGSPIELYKFANLEDQFYYTSTNIPIIFDGSTYIPKAISRTGDKLTATNDARQMVVKLPADDVFVARYISTIPAQPDELTIFRQHYTDSPTPETVTFFKGKVSNCAITGDEAKINCSTDGAILDRNIPVQTTRNLCAFVLYDPRCKVIDTSFVIDVEIVSVSTDGITIVVDGGANTVPNTGLQLSAQLTADAAFFTGGTLERGGLERRMVRGITNLGGNQASITSLFPFATISVGQAFKMFAGCQLDFDICRTRFNNTINYGGFPSIPGKNPFESGIDK